MDTKKHRWEHNVHKLIGGWSIQKDILGILPLLMRRNILIQRLFLLAYGTAENTQFHICEERATDAIWGVLSKDIQVSCNLKSFEERKLEPRMICSRTEENHDRNNWRLLKGQRVCPQFYISIITRKWD